LLLFFVLGSHWRSIIRAKRGLHILSSEVMQFVNVISDTPT